MRTFLDELDRRLVDAAVPRATVPRRVVAAGTLAAVALWAGSSAVLPVLGARPADARALAGKPGVPPADRFDLGASRAFPTPDGPGHIIPSHDGRRLCVVLPDRSAPGTYGSSCATLARIDARGLAGEMVAAGRPLQPGRSLVAFVLPSGTGASVELVGPDGEALAVSVHSGVAVATLQTEALLRFDVDGAARVHRFEAPFVDDDVVLRCADRVVARPAPSPANTPARLGDRSRWCRR